ncbi:acyl-CoA thioesterase [Tunturiibacter lichenicola]|uniref:acyl-CoA thioesterase n=1 Tax=Tunturiibacter lichenicola TaxID=2051959 RepID=UPI0021B3E964|nr:thioesterase family protein [Edaphobacter lichenicola]
MTEVLAERYVGEARVRVRYAETDQMGVVYHSNYLIWFEVGRVELIRSMGLDYKRMEAEEGCGIAVVDVHVKYRAPARYDDELVVETRLLASRGAVIRFGYKVLRVADGVLLCEGETVHVVVGKDMKKQSLPPKYAERFGAYLKSQASHPGDGLKSV